MNSANRRLISDYDETVSILVLDAISASLQSYLVSKHPNGTSTLECKAYNDKLWAANVSNNLYASIAYNHVTASVHKSNLNIWSIILADGEMDINVPFARSFVDASITGVNKSHWDTKLIKQ